MSNNEAQKREQLENIALLAMYNRARVKSGGQPLPAVDDSMRAICTELLDDAKVVATAMLPVFQSATEQMRPLVEALHHAEAQISATPHGDNCFLTSDPVWANECFCGKDTALRSVTQALATIEQGGK